MDAGLILLPAFVMTMLMVITHTYLGLHILARGIIFADLALAQIAALGASVAFLQGEESHSTAAQLYAFGATFIAAILFAQLRRIKSTTTREATIGCIYVVATALSIVILSQSAQGMEELKGIFNGNILWVSWDEIAIIGLVYATLAILHFTFREPLSDISFGVHKHTPKFRWELLFFISFATVITMAVSVAGVLLVFALLIIPAFSASLVHSRYFVRMLIAWLLGAMGIAIGLWVAFVLDLPVGASVVSVMGILPLLAVGFASVRKLQANNKIGQSMDSESH